MLSFFAPWHKNPDAPARLPSRGSACCDHGEGIVLVAREAGGADANSSGGINITEGLRRKRVTHGCDIRGHREERTFAPEDIMVPGCAFYQPFGERRGGEVTNARPSRRRCLRVVSRGKLATQHPATTSFVQSRYAAASLSGSVGSESKKATKAGAFRVLFGRSSFHRTADTR